MRSPRNFAPYGCARRAQRKVRMFRGLPFRHSPLFLVAQHARVFESLDENTKRVIPPFALATHGEYFSKEELFFQFFRFVQENRVVFPFLLQPQTVGKDCQNYLAN